MRGIPRGPRRILLLLLSLCLAGISVIAAEIVMALRREYLVEGPAERIEGSFGEEGLPVLRLVALGDSTSVGVGTDPAHAFPVVLAERLSAQAMVHLTVLGRSGDRTAHLAAEQLPAVWDLDPDLVIICVGANDATHVTPLRKVRASMGEILDHLEERGYEVLVVGPPDMGAKAFMEPLRSLSRWSGERVSRAIEEEARERSVDFVPLAKLTGPLFAEDPDTFFSKDDFHPSADGYRLWVDAIAPYAEKAAARVIGAAAQSG